MVTSGKKRESLTGNATLHLFPHLKPLSKMPNLTDYLTTEISTSRQKKFSMVTLVDTPGLVDGDMAYPFDVNESILWFSELCDLVFVFFDPIGQALCKRTLNIVEKISSKHPERMRFYLSKADEAGHESDRQRVMMQIVQELCKRPGLNKTGFDMPTIYVPNPNKQVIRTPRGVAEIISILSVQVRCVNQIEEVCKDIEKTINQTIQNTLNSLEKDCDSIEKLVDEAINKDNRTRASNLRAWLKSGCLYLLAMVLPVALAVTLVLAMMEGVVMDLMGKEMTNVLKWYTLPIKKFWSSYPPDYQLYGALGLIVTTLVLLGLASFLGKTSATLTRKQKRQLLDKQEFVR